MMSESFAPVSIKCKVCGGSIRSNYVAGTCYCENCGNRWNITEVVPNIDKYSKIISNITMVIDTLQGEPSRGTINEARLTLKTAIMDCKTINDPISNDLIKICNENIAELDKLAIYVKGKKFLEDKSYRNARSEFAKLPGFRDIDALKEQCESGIKEERKKHIPWAVIFSWILPAILSLFLKEKCGLPLGAVIPIFIVCSAGLGYVLYIGGVWSIIIEIASFLLATPLIIYSILAYACHMAVVPSVVIAIVVPIVALVFFEMLSKLTDTKKRKED